MFYGIYKDLRDGVWQCLLKTVPARLPIDVLAIAKRMKIRVVKNSQAAALSKGELGKSFFDGEEWFIIYDDSMDVPNSRYTIAHELGHILLGHELAHAKYFGAKEFTKKPKSEQQADMFAVRLLCPACILWALDLHDAEDISAVCKVPKEVARQRAKRMAELYERNKFLTSNTEKLVFDNFKDYIESAKRLRRF